MVVIAGIAAEPCQFVYVWQTVCSITCLAREQRVGHILRILVKIIEDGFGALLRPQFTLMQHVPMLVCSPVGALKC